MPPKSKGKAKVVSKGTTPSRKSDTSDPPQPFSRAPAKLEPFLSKLSTKHVYITHIDFKPRDYKRKIFMIPIGMNLSIIAFLLWRVFTIGPYYMKICWSMMGHRNETTMDPENLPWESIGYEVVLRTVTFMIDFLLYVFVWPWPRNFFAGQTNGNPVFWRFGIGFRNKEIIVRRSRRWDTEIGNVVGEESEGSQLFLMNVRKAVAPAWMSEKTGYLMQDKAWDLDWALMVKAEKFVDKKTLALDDFRTAIYVYRKEYGWLIFEAVNTSGSTKEEEGRKKIRAFKDELTAMGKENLFFRWIELIQYESSKPEGFGPEQREVAMRKAKDMFEAQGIDFEAFWAKIGGMDGMPGLD